MPGITSELVQLDARIAELNEGIRLLDAENEALQTQIHENTRKRVELRKQREGLSRLRETAAANQRITTHEQAAAAATEAANAVLADLQAKQKEVDELVAKLKQSQ